VRISGKTAALVGLAKLCWQKFAGKGWPLKSALAQSCPAQSFVEKGFLQKSLNVPKSPHWRGF
jgi:hypothetical protein